MRCGEKILLARSDPAYWPPERAGREGDHDVLGVNRRLHAERAADIGRHDPYPLPCETERVGDVVSCPMRRLGSAPDRELLRERIPVCHGRAALERRRRHPRMPDGDLSGRGRVGESAFGVAAPPRVVDHHIAGHPGDEGRGGEGRLEIADRLQRFEVHFDPIGRLQRRRLALGHKGDNRLTDAMHLLPGQYRHVGCVEITQNGVDAGSGQVRNICADVEPEDTGCRPRLLQAQPPDRRARERAANEDHRKAAIRVMVSDKSPAARQ